MTQAPPSHRPFRAQMVGNGNVKIVTRSYAPAKISQTRLCTLYPFHSKKVDTDLKHGLLTGPNASRKMLLLRVSSVSGTPCHILNKFGFHRRPFSLVRTEENMLFPLPVRMRQAPFALYSSPIISRALQYALWRAESRLWSRGFSSLWCNVII